MMISVRDSESVDRWDEDLEGLLENEDDDFLPGILPQLARCDGKIRAR